MEGVQPGIECPGDQVIHGSIVEGDEGAQRLRRKPTLLAFVAVGKNQGVEVFEETWRKRQGKGGEEMGPKLSEMQLNIPCSTYSLSGV